MAGHGCRGERGRRADVAGGRAGGSDRHGAEALGERAERADVDDHFLERRARAEVDHQLLRLRHQGAEPRLRSHRRWRRHGARGFDPRHLRPERHRLLHRRCDTAGLARPARARHRPHRGAARAARDPVRRALHGRHGAPDHQGPGHGAVLRHPAWRRLEHRPHRQPELHRRWDTQHPTGRRLDRAAPHRLLRRPGGLLQAQLVHRSGDRPGHLPPAVHHRAHDRRQRRRPQYLRWFGEPDHQGERQSHHHPARHAAAGGLQRPAARRLPQPGPIEEIKDYQRFVEEARFASQLQGPIQFVVGAFFSDFHGRVPFASLYPPSEVPGLDAIFTGGPPNNPDGFPNLVFAQDFHTDVKEPAVFGEFSWDIAKALKATVGLRWYQVKTTSFGFEEGLAVGGGKILSPEVTDSETGTNPKFELDYHFDPDKMVYGLAAKGFRPGGVVPIVPPGTPGTPNDCVAALAQVNPNITLDDTRSFHSDSLWNYELGAKTAWLDHRLTLNAAGFYIKWPHIQQAVLLPCGFQFIANAGAAESKGGELELRAAATEHLQASLGVGYQDAKITEAGESAQAVGSPVFDVPNWTGNGALSYTMPIGNAWSFMGEVDYSYVGSSFSSSNSSPVPRERPAYRLLDARLALSSGATEIALVGKNLSNTVTNLGDNRSIAAEVPGRPRLFR